ncbi:MAG: ComF family protein [Bacteroidia bacterium]|nr:ComF family protein [Bacteroidia bacterium]
MINDALSLFFPVLCAACDAGLVKGEEHICTQCLYKLPKTNFHSQYENPMDRLLWGRVNVDKAAAYYMFSKEGKVQKLIHKLKYKGQKEIGLTIGKHFAHELNETCWLREFDAIIPVPLHKSKLRKRGYNQSEYFATGISAVSKIPVITECVTRILPTTTQTRKSRYLRWKNVNDVFKIKNPHMVEGKNILLVDDVVTTGSTLEACAEKILELKNTKISVATIAYSAH